MTQAGRSSRGVSRPIYRRAFSLMGTVFTIDVVLPSDSPSARHEVEEVVDDALSWCRSAEDVCSRFDVRSELRQLVAQPCVPVPVSAMLCQVLQFSVACAAASGGAFDPTVGHRMESRGFNRDYRSGAVTDAGAAVDDDVTYRDVVVDVEHQTVMLRRALVLDLGGVAKGLAVDLAASALHGYRDFAVDAGGDLFLSGVNADQEPWRVGIRHPRAPGEMIDVVRVSDCAVCTSGDYERRSVEDGESHLLDGRTRRPATRAVSATVIAPTAVVADAFATAAFALGPDAGLRFLSEHGVEGMIIDADLVRHRTAGFGH